MAGRVFDLEKSIQIQDILYTIADICERQRMTQYNIYYELVKEYRQWRPSYQLRRFDDINEIYEELAKIIIDMCSIRNISLQDYNKRLCNL